MKAFHFSLEKALEWRRIQLEQEENRLKQQVANLHMLDQTFAQLVSDREDAGRKLLAEPSVAGADLESLDRYRVFVEHRLRELARRSKEQGARVAEQQQKRMEALRRCRLLEKLRQRRLTDWQRELDRESETFASEAFLARWKPRPASSSARPAGGSPRT